MGYKLCMVEADTSGVYQTVREQLEARQEFKLACLNTAEALFLKLQSGYAPDVIVLDKRLPDMDAARICSLLSQMRAYHDIPLIVISQGPEENLREQVMAKGAFDFLLQPLHFDAFRERLYQAVSARRENLKIRALFEKEPEVPSALLTHLPGPRAFQTYLKKECATAVLDVAPLSLLLLDVDFLGPYNDHFGRGQGDAFLRRLAQLVGKVAPRAACFQVADDGFAIVQRYLQRDEALKMAERLCQRVKLFDLPHAPVTGLPFLSISVGAATMQSPQEGSCKLLHEAATQALFQAKTWGRAQARQYFAL